MIEKTMKELEQAEKPQANSRSWKDPHGLPISGTLEQCGLVADTRPQTDGDLFPNQNTAARPRWMTRSEASYETLRKGSKRSTTGEYIQFIGIVKGV